MAAMALPALPHFQPDADTGLGCILDTETTGLGSTDEAIELALLLFAYQRSTGTVLGVVDEYAGLREPTVPIQPGAEAVHGISAAEVRGQQLDYLRVESILARAEFIIAHNASFDYRFVCPLSETAKEKPWLCSMTGVDWYGKGFQSRALQRLLGEHKIRLPQAHRAMADVYGVLYLLTEQQYLAELLQPNRHRT